MAFSKLVLGLLVLLTVMRSTWTRFIPDNRWEMTGGNSEDSGRYDEIGLDKYSSLQDEESASLKEESSGENGKANSIESVRRDIDERNADDLRSFLYDRKAKAERGQGRRVGRGKRSWQGKGESGRPFSAQRLDKMLEKAIYKIITGDLSTADILLLKSFNYSLEQVLAIRERELGKKIGDSSRLNADKMMYEQKLINDLTEAEQSTVMGESNLANPEENDGRMLDEEAQPEESKRKSQKKKMKKRRRKIAGKGKIDGKNGGEGDFDYDAYNRQAVYDYENGRTVEVPPPDRALDYRSTTAASVNYDYDYDQRRSGENTKIDTGLIIPPSIGFPDLVDTDDIQKNFNKAVERHVVFKIRYDDSDLESESMEKRHKALFGEKDGKSLAKKRNRAGDNKHGDRTGPTVERAQFPVSTETPENDTSSTARQTFLPTVKIDDVALLPLHPTGPGNSTNERGTFNEGLEEGLIDISNETEEVFKTNNSGKINDYSSSTYGPETTQTSGYYTSPPSDDFDMNTVPTDQPSISENFQVYYNDSMDSDDWSTRKSIYEGLEWVEDDVYRVIPEAMDSLNYYYDAAAGNEMENDTIDDDSAENETTHVLLGLRGSRHFQGVVNDTIDYQNASPEEKTSSLPDEDGNSMRNSPNVNLSTYQQLALAHRREGNLTSQFDSQGQKAIEDIKLKVLAMTGRFNLTSSGNQVQRERLTMISPICQTPRNTDLEAWSDPFLMNMHFQLNLTAGDHVVAAKMRIYTLPQNNITLPSEGNAELDADDQEEKKIRISVYFYTKSLKKHRSKKRLIDSVVVALTTEGSHWALDVRQALRFWRQNGRNSHGISNNYGLVIQVEDQDGRSLKPSQYIQQDSCHTSANNQDEKAYQRVPALFLQACSRYVRVVNGQPITYVNCSKSSRRH